MPRHRISPQDMSLTTELVAMCERPVADPGPRPGITYFTPQELEETLDKLLAENGPHPLWVFAYGSLIWNPGFVHDSYRLAHVKGWHRCFSMKLERWRGTPEQPGLMLALERGGSCDGIAYRLPEASKRQELANLLNREIDGREDMPFVRWVTVRAEGETHRALVFWALPTGRDFPTRPTLEQAAHMLARACGHMGSGAAYLHRTVEKLAEHGIRDRNLWTLQEMVATEIKALNGR